MALYPAPDMRTGAISIWVAGAEEAERAAGVVRELGHVGRGRRRRRANDPLRARGAAARLAHPAARQVDLAPGGDRRRDGGGGDADRATTSTPPTRARPSRAVQALGAKVERDFRRRADGTLDAADPRRRPARARSRPRSTSATPAPCCGILPGWLAGQPGGEWTLDGDESIRRRPVDRVAEPLRRMGAEVSARDGRLPPLTVRGAELHGIEYRLAGRQRAGQVVPAARRPARRRPTSVIEQRPTRDHTERMLRAAGATVRSERAGTPVTIHGELPARRVDGRARRARSSPARSRSRRTSPRPPSGSSPRCWSAAARSGSRASGSTPGGSACSGS